MDKTSIQFTKMDFEKLKKQKKHILLARIGSIIFFMLSLSVCCFSVFSREDGLFSQSTIRLFSVIIVIISVYCFVYTFMVLSDLYSIINFASQYKVLKVIIEIIEYDIKHSNNRTMKIIVLASGKDNIVTKKCFYLKRLLERSDLGKAIIDIQNKCIYIPFGFKPEQLNNADADLTSFKNFISDAASSPLINTKHSYS